MRLRNPGLPDWINDYNAQILGEDAHDAGDVKIEKRIHVSRRRVNFALKKAMRRRAWHIITKITRERKKEN